MTDAPMPAHIAAAPVGEAMRFVIDQIRGRGSAPLEAYLARFTPDYAAVIKARLATVTAGADPFAVDGYRRPNANVCVAELRSDDGRRWALGVGMVDGVIRYHHPEYIFPQPPGLSYRPVARTDAEALAALELAAPIVTGDIETAYDKSRDYFEAERLMGGEAFVVEREGAIVGLFATVVHPIRIAGHDLRGVYDHRVRVHPAARRSGVMGLAALGRFEAFIGRSDIDVGYSFVAVDNAAVLGSRPGPFWPETAERLVIDTGGAAATGRGRPATAADAERLAALLNDAHGEEELFCPYTPASLHERLSRAPDSYGWSSFLASPRACVGVWAPKVGVIRRARGVETRDVRAFVLDHGCTSDGLDELVALVNDWRARLAAEGTTELSIFTSAGSRGAAALRALAKRREPYVVLCGALPGEDVGERGIYVDQLYF